VAPVSATSRREPGAPGACPDEEALLGYLEAGLGGAGSPALEAHVDGCERCRQVVAALGPLPLYGEGQGVEGGTLGGETARVGPSAASTTLASARPPAGEEAWDGKVLAGKYRVLGELGRGGMGVVLEAEHVGVSERFAIKLVRAEGGEGGVKRLMREAKLAAQVGGRHVARVYDVGALGDGRMFLVMERLYGEDLQSTLRRRGALPLDEAVGYVEQACEAVGRAHAAGVIHRDLKPANLFLANEDGGGVVVKVLDFGLAKLAERPRIDDELSLTTSATVIGSPRYMSPEQIRDARGVDERSDVWSLGVILFEMLAGEPPFAGTTISGLWASIVADPPRPLKGLRPEVPGALAALVEACLAKDPRERPASVAELSRRVREACERGAEAAPPSRPADAPAGAARASRAGRRRLAAALSIAAAIGLASIGVALSRGAPAGAGPAEAPTRAVAEAPAAAKAPPTAEGATSGGAPSGGASSPGAGPPSVAEAPASAVAAAPPASAATRRFERGRGSKEAGHRVHGAASANDIFFGKETDSRH
jgi:predicted Ser/Thr protein kinase